MTSPDDYDDYDWKELPIDIKVAFETLGYTEELWDADEEPEICKEYDFDELSDEQKAAALKIGYTQETWDEE
eukprot:CAMPEP_0195266402 /NCGR_PEP_ID=MMETSP0706-20130129/11991_1 /TAXON_ID=33640 /ORGANISM="Asterionellopsis glacialis, Strain CCMP134" /LENGTH=71 /DNA_ID=CAMNT_0040320991 /DNA_START=256 /DNA_END=471 /DNA_ORIENTATION=-